VGYTQGSPALRESSFVPKLRLPSYQPLSAELPGRMGPTLFFARLGPTLRPISPPLPPAITARLQFRWYCPTSRQKRLFVIASSCRAWQAPRLNWPASVVRPISASTLYSLRAATRAQILTAGRIPRSHQIEVKLFLFRRIQPSRGALFRHSHFVAQPATPAQFALWIHCASGSSRYSALRPCLPPAHLCFIPLYITLLLRALSCSVLYPLLLAVWAFAGGRGFLYWSCGLFKSGVFSAAVLFALLAMPGCAGTAQLVHFAAPNRSRRVWLCTAGGLPWRRVVLCVRLHGLGVSFALAFSHPAAYTSSLPLYGDTHALPLREWRLQHRNSPARARRWRL